MFMALGGHEDATNSFVTSDSIETPLKDEPALQVYRASPSSPSTPSYKHVLTTKFWVGEEEGPENDYIANDDSYWDIHWVEHYGGVDTPECRNGYLPCGFTPKENPFYIALPYGEYRADSRSLKESVQQIPWFSSTRTTSLLKNQWIEVTYKSTTCYGQWEDVGPFLIDDFDYVFGDAPPSNTFGVRAGLDVSPALWDCLGLTTNATTSWRFVDAVDVPEGPWTKVITTSGLNWN